MAKSLESTEADPRSRDRPKRGCFHTICLLDEFTASGTTYIRQMP